VQTWWSPTGRPNTASPPRCLSPCTSTSTLMRLAKLFRDTGNNRASFMNPYNPFSVPSSERANRFKRALLRFLLPESRLPTVAHDPTGRWPALAFHAIPNLGTGKGRGSYRRTIRTRSQFLPWSSW
jgi:hypothetical protein